MLLREHRRQPRGWRHVHPRDVSARTPATTVQLLARAQSAGAAIGKVCDAIHARSGEAGVRRIQGVLSLAKKHGVKSAEDACESALEVGCPDYHFVRKWIERHPQAPLTLRQVDPLIRELSQYRELVSHLTSTTESA